MKPILKSGPGLIFAIPTLGRPVSLDWALAFKSLSPPINYNTILQTIKGVEIGVARSNFAQFAVEQSAKYLFFLGDDVIVPPHTLRQLIYRMEQVPDAAVVGGVYCSKCDPAAPLVFRGNGNGSYWDWKIGEFFECTGLGMDCTLIRVSIFEKLSKPWFQTLDKDNYLDNENKAESWTEDLYFCNKIAEETSLKIYCDASVICEHEDIYNGRKYSLPKDSLPKRQLGTNGKKLLVVGPAINLTPDVLADYAVVRLNNDELADYRGHYSSLPFATNEFDWVIVQGIKTDYREHFDEWHRVLKTGSKLSLNFDPIFNLDYINKLGKFEKNGDYLELVNNA